MNKIEKRQQPSKKEPSLFYKIFTNKEVLIAMGSTLLLLVVFQFGAHITAPGLKLNNTNNEDGGPNIISLLNLLGGGGLTRISLFAVGISPYVTAQIIIQMLSTDIIKPLAELKKSGERGRRKMELYTRLLTLPFAIATAYGTMVLVSNANLATFIVNGATVTNLSSVPAGNQVLMVLMFIAGTYIALFLSDIISKKGVGNGTTLIIMSGIISGVPRNLTAAYNFLTNKATGEASQFVGLATFIIYFFFYLLILLVIVFINGAVRKIPIQQTGQGLVKKISDLPFLPIKLIPAGVIPVIFAGSIMAIPGTIAEFVRNSDPTGYQFIQSYLTLNTPVGITIYAFLIIVFSFFYSHIQINAEQLTENFEKSGRFIPGVNIGQATFNHIRRVINRINWLGAPFLAFIAILPNILTITGGLPASASLGGTGVIILVSGSIQLWDAIKSTNTSVSYRVQRKILQEKVSSNYDLLLAEAMGINEDGSDPDNKLEKYKEAAKKAKEVDDSDDWQLW